MRLKNCAIGVLFAMSAIGIAYGAPWELKGTIPFQFMTGKSVWPAGTYELIPNPETGLLTIQPPSGSPKVVQVITRLAAETHAKATGGQAVFDKVGDTYTLSEIWFPDEDGFLVHATRGKHEHHVVPLPHQK